MARIDPLVRHLFEFGADAIGLGSGHKVMLVAGGARRPITAAPMPLNQVESILSEMAPASMLGDINKPGKHEFTYRAPDGTVAVEVHRAVNELRIVVRPAADTDPVEEDPGEGFDSPGLPQTGATEIPDEIKAIQVVSRQDAMDKIEQAALDAGQLGGGGAPPPPVANTPAPAAAAPTTVNPSRPDIPYVTPGDNAPIDTYFRQLVERGGSDLYVCSDKPVIIRRDGDLVRLGDNSPLNPGQAEHLLFGITPVEYRREFYAANDVDFAYEIPGLARFRCNIFRDRRGVGGIFRQIPSKILSAEDLNLPKAVLDMCNLNKGLVVVTGPTGSGKSTTLAAMIDYINRTQSSHIITIEDPIEFVHEDKSCVINQRELRTHTDSFKNALRAALREDPDIVLVGEMRDLETVAIAIETAETGHLVFGTLHTNTAPSTVDRIIDQFPADRQAQIRTMLSESLRGVVAQTLLKKNGGGRVAGLEILVVTPSVSNIIREGKTFQLPSIMQTGKSMGMVTLNDALVQLIKAGTVTKEEALAKAVDKNDFKNTCRRNQINLD